MLERLPEVDRVFIKTQVEQGFFTSEIECVRDAVRRRREEEEGKKREKYSKFYALIMEGHGQALRGETAPYTPDFMERSRQRAIENHKTGKPIPDHVKP